MKINQYCSVCKQHLDMEVIPTDDTGDDGVIWLRCPQCQGFLPKFSGDSRAAPSTPPAGAVGNDDQTSDASRASTPSARSAVQRSVQDNSRVDGFGIDPGPADGELAESHDQRGAGSGGPELAAEDVETDDTDAMEHPPAPGGTRIAAEPFAEYAAALAAADLSRSRPYRATESYAVGDVIHHLAHGDVGVVVAKEKLPGGRLAVKVYFEEAGVVHLIEQSPLDSH